MSSSTGFLIQQPHAPRNSAGRAALAAWLLALSWIACEACALRPPAPAPSPTRIAPALPPGVPKRVGVALLAGDATLSRPLTGQLVDALRSFGFEVTGPEQVAAVLPSADSDDLLDASLRGAIAGQLSIEWLFTGVLESDHDSPGATKIRVRVLDLSTGRLAWAIDRGQQSPGSTPEETSATGLEQDLSYVLELFELDVLHPNEGARIEAAPDASKAEPSQEGGAPGKN